MTDVEVMEKYDLYQTSNNFDAGLRIKKIMYIDNISKISKPNLSTGHRLPTLSPTKRTTISLSSSVATADSNSS